MKMKQILGIGLALVGIGALTGCSATVEDKSPDTVVVPDNKPDTVVVPEDKPDIIVTPPSGTTGK